MLDKKTRIQFGGVMKKLIMTVIILVIATMAYAKDCRTVDDCIMWFDGFRAGTVAKVCAFNGAQCKAMMRSDIVDGAAVGIDKGTRVDDVHSVPDTPCDIVEMNGRLLVTFKGIVKCR